MTQVIEPEVMSTSDKIKQDIVNQAVEGLNVPPEFLNLRGMENVTPTDESEDAYTKKRMHELEEDVTKLIHGILEATSAEPIEFTSSSDTIDADIVTPSAAIPQDVIDTWSNNGIQTEAVYETSNYPLSYAAEQNMLEELKEALSDNWPDQNKYDAIYLVLQKYKLVR